MVKVFRVIINILMVICFLCVFILGILIVEGQGVFKYIDNSIGYIFMVLGPILVILIFGFICTILQIDDHLMYIKFAIQDIRKVIKQEENTDDNKSWKCPVCNHLNPNNAFDCRKCGYRLIK